MQASTGEITFLVTVKIKGFTVPFFSDKGVIQTIKFSLLQTIQFHCIKIES